jgi:isoleucyl-tRNA synthetase
LGDDLKFIFITSSAKVALVNTPEEEGVTVTASTEKKCERCWHYRADVGINPAHAGLCKRCDDNLFGHGEARHFA